MAPSKLPQREIEIAQRLKAYRLGKRISRAAFASAIGIGTERLASYESARAPLKYKIFRLIEKEFHLNATWLALGGDWQPEARPMGDEEVPDQIPDQALFSEAFDVYLKDLRYEKSRFAKGELQIITDLLVTMAAQARTGKVPKSMLRRAENTVRKLQADMEAALRLSARVKSLVPTTGAPTSARKKKH